MPRAPADSRIRLLGLADPVGLEDTVRRVVSDLSDERERYRKGEAKLFGFFMGQVMRATKGKGDPKVVRDLLRRFLDEA